MARLAVITDVHGDVHALRDALARIAELGVERVACLGDLVDYGLFPGETIALLRDRAVECIRGNHDRWCIADGGISQDLDEDEMAFLRGLPGERRLEVGDVHIVLAHGRPGNDMHGLAADNPGWELAQVMDTASADVLFVGHTHQPFVRRLPDGRMVCNPGALLRDPAPGVDIATPGTSPSWRSPAEPWESRSVGKEW